MKKKSLGIFLAMGIVLILVGLALAFFSYNSIVVRPTPIITMLSPTPMPTPDPLASYSILLMGYGGGIHEGGRLTDSMMVVRVIPHEEKITLISIPRDLWVQLPIDGDTTKGYKINAAYAIGSDDRGYPNKKVEFLGKAGGGEMAKNMVSQVVGIPINYFAALDFDGFIKIIDILGGIEVNVLKTFDDLKYPLETGTAAVDNCGKTPDEVTALTATMSGEKLEDQFLCRYETLHFEKGIQNMDGKTALKYARSRHSPTDGGDFNRAARQRQIFLAVKQKVINIGFVSKIIPTLKTLTYNLTTDIDINMVSDLIGKAKELQSYKITSIALTDGNFLISSYVDKQSVLIPKAGIDNFDEIHNYIANPLP
jgi:LCP family protein required for cell wall assembly